MSNYQDQINALTERVAALEARAAIPSFAPRTPQPGDEGLFDALRSWRRERAEADDVKTFQVFGDSTLAAISTVKPRDKFELSKIKGIGDNKIALYGGEVLAIVCTHVGAPQRSDPATCATSPAVHRMRGDW